MRTTEMAANYHAHLVKAQSEIEQLKRERDEARDELRFITSGSAFDQRSKVIERLMLERDTAKNNLAAAKEACRSAKKSLIAIRDRCQVTEMSFEDQSFQNIAQAAEMIRVFEKLNL